MNRSEWPRRSPSSINGGRPHELARTHPRTFSEKVLPRLEHVDSGPEIGLAMAS